MQLDVTEAEDLMDEFFKEFNVDRGNFNINTYYPDEPFHGIHSKNSQW